MKGRIIGVNFIMKKFDFYFGCCLGKNVLRQTDILSKSLQSSSLSAAEGQDMATIVENLRGNNLDGNRNGNINCRVDVEVLPYFMLRKKARKKCKQTFWFIKAGKT